MRDEDFGDILTFSEGDDGPFSLSPAEPAGESPDWKSLYAEALACAERERLRAEGLRQSEMAARRRASGLEGQLDRSRKKLDEAVREAKDIRRASKDALFHQSEVKRLEKLLSQAGVDSSRRSTMMSLRMEVFRLRAAQEAPKSRKEMAGPGPEAGSKSPLPKAAPATDKAMIRHLQKEIVRLQQALERLEGWKDEIASLRRKVAALLRSKRRAKASRPPRASIELRKVRERARRQKETMRTMRQEIGFRDRENRRLNRENGRLLRELEPLRDIRKTVRRLSEENRILHGGLADQIDQWDRIARLKRAIGDMNLGRWRVEREKRELEAELARRPLLPAMHRELRRRDREIASLEKTIAKLEKANGTLAKRHEKLKEAKREQGVKVRVLRARIADLEDRNAKLRATGAVLSKALFRSRSEKQDRPATGRSRGHQPGREGHGRTPRPALREKEERHDPPKEARVCSDCGKPYVANGGRSSSVIEIQVKAHVRKIVRPCWLRGCDCASSPAVVAAPPPVRLFPRTPYGISVWARILFERFACFRPLRRVAAWLADQGLAISPGTIADSIPRFLPLFVPLARAILEHQNSLAVRHGDETGWRIQSLSRLGRSQRAWLWVSVGAATVYFHIDPSRSAEVAKKLFGAAEGVVYLVCDRYTAYLKLARELDGKVILCWCWAHVRRDFIDCAAGQVRLTRWCQEWIGRIASIYRLNEARLEHHDPGTGCRTPEFDAAQGELEKAVKALFADAERELAALPDSAREGKALRSLLKHRDGLTVFVDRPEVPMDNNTAERILRNPVIGRRSSFGSDSGEGAEFTAAMYSVLGTLSLNGIDILRWLEAWLTDCAENGRKPPDDLSSWLPWSMSEERRQRFIAPG